MSALMAYPGLPATWRCTHPADAAGARCIAVDTAAGTVWLQLDAQSVQHLHQTTAPTYDAEVRAEAASLAHGDEGGCHAG